MGIFSCTKCNGEVRSLHHVCGQKDTIKCQVWGGGHTYKLR